MLTNKKIKTLIVLLILLLGFFARKINYDRWPREGATFDEFAWPWLGISLLQKHVPMSWSPHGQYKNFELKIFRDARFRIVQPYLEHPPLFGLISGAYSLLAGASGMYDPDFIRPTQLRKLSLALGTISVFLVYLLSSKIYDQKTGRLASLLYATVPSVAVGSRLLQNENFMIPVWLVSLYLLFLYLEKKKKVFLRLTMIISALMIWAKIPWFVIGASVGAILFLKGRRRDCLSIGLSLAISLALFFVYGYFWDWPTFIGLWGLQLARYDIGLQTILSIFTHPFLTDRILIDGWIYFGWLAMFILLGQFKKHLWIVTPFLIYFLFYVWAVPGIQMQGWYRYPFFPFLIMAIAHLIIRLIEEPSLLALVFQFIVGSTAFLNGWEPIFGISFSFFRLLLLAWALPALFFFFISKRFKKFYQFSLTFWLIIFILLNISTCRLYNEQ